MADIDSFNPDQQKFESLLERERAITARMLKIAPIGVGVSAVACFALIGLPFLLGFINTFILGKLRQRYEPKPGKFYLVPGVVVGLVNTAIGVLLYWTIQYLYAQNPTNPFSGLFAFITAPFFVTNGVAILLASLVRMVSVNSVARKLPKTAA